MDTEHLPFLQHRQSHGPSHTLVTTLCTQGGPRLDFSRQTATLRELKANLALLHLSTGLFLSLCFSEGLRHFAPSYKLCTPIIQGLLGMVLCSLVISDY